MLGWAAMAHNYERANAWQNSRRSARPVDRGAETAAAGPILVEKSKTLLMPGK